MATTQQVRARLSHRRNAYRPAHYPRWYIPAVAVGDVAAGAAGLLAGLVATPVGMLVEVEPFLLVAGAGWPLLLAARGAYKPRYLGTRDEYGCASRILVEAVALFAVATVVFGFEAPPAEALVALPVILGGSLVTRRIGRRVVRQLGSQGRAVHRVVAVGTGPGVTSLIDQLAANLGHDMVVVGACAEGDRRVVEDIPVIRRLPDARFGDADVSDEEAAKAVVEAALEVSASTVCVTGCSQFIGDRMRALTWALAERGISLAVITGLGEVALHRMQLGRAGDVALINVYPVRVAGLPALVKQVFDRVGAAVGLVFLLPALALIAIAVRVSDPGPALYRTTRISEGGRTFTMYKFRTMVADADAQRFKLTDFNEHDGKMFKLRNDPRMTRVGRFLRRTSLDELPQLFNVLRGQMSLVGPRPPLPEEVDGYTRLERRRLLVRSGMTGLWQVSGRSDLSWEETVRLDLRYVDNWRLREDAALLWRTTRAVVKGTGAY